MSTHNVIKCTEKRDLNGNWRKKKKAKQFNCCYLPATDVEFFVVVTVVINSIELSLLLLLLTCIMISLLLKLSAIDADSDWSIDSWKHWIMTRYFLIIAFVLHAICNYIGKCVRLLFSLK